MLEVILMRVRAALESDDYAAAAAALEMMRAPDQAELFAGLDDHHQSALLTRLDPEDSADILEELEDEAAARLVTALPHDAAARIIDEMEPDEAVDLLGELEPDDQERVLARLEDEAEIRPLLLHPEDTAGGLMTSEFLALGRRMTVAEALAALREWKPGEEVNEVYTIDSQGRLSGMVGMRRLLMEAPAAVLIDIAATDVVSVPIEADQEEVARLMARYDLSSLPVVDGRGVLAGVVTVDDIIDVIEEEATEDFQRFGGTEPLDRPYLESGILTVVRKRIGWLLLLFLTETLTGSVLRHFEQEMAAVVSLAFFIPLLIGTGGNAGSQTTSTIIRALAVEDLDKRGLWRPMIHELAVGLVLGGIMGVVAYGRALLWGTGPAVALTVAIAIAVIVVWANILGSVLPIVAGRLRIDPTVVSGPAMSTLVDATGLFIYFTIAGIILAL
jgi:magnesium transporter